MKKPLKSSWLRTLIPVAFILFTVVGTIWHTGWGTLSSFGWKEIAAICPLGALETMLAEKTILPRALVALAVFFVLVVIFGRFFCGWLCPVPSVSRLLQFLKTDEKRKKMLRRKIRNGRLFCRHSRHKTSTRKRAAFHRVPAAQAAVRVKR